MHRCIAHCCCAQAQDKMAFVIIRPGGLTNDPASGNGVLTESTTTAGSISRDDVAALVVKALLSKKADGKASAKEKRKKKERLPVQVWLQEKKRKSTQVEEALPPSIYTLQVTMGFDLQP
eukprot:1158561-Pelagomonas_calceolata.AAC.1